MFLKKDGNAGTIDDNKEETQCRSMNSHTRYKRQKKRSERHLEIEHRGDTSTKGCTK